MRQLFYSGATALAIALSVNSAPLLAQAAPAPSAKTGQPKAQFSETTFDFGKVQPTDTCKHEFIVTNMGTATLEITAVQPGCGCTTAGTWDRIIEPGKTGKIPIQFNPGSFTGPVSKGVNITCNDPAQPTQYLQISAAVWRPIEVQPQFAYFMPVTGEETNETKVVRIVNNGDGAITLGAPESASALFKTELKTVKPGKEFELHILYSGPVSNAQPQGNISIKTSSAAMPIININAVAMPQPAIVTFPTPLQLPAGPFTAEHQQAVTVRNNSRTPLKLTGPTVNVEGVTVRVQELDPGKIATLTVVFPAGFQSKSGQAMELSFNTTHPNNPVIKVPITQMAPVVPVPPTVSAGGGK